MHRELRVMRSHKIRGSGDENALNLEMSVSTSVSAEARAVVKQAPHRDTLRRSTTWRKWLVERCDICIEIASSNEWSWVDERDLSLFRGRHFSPSLSGDSYLKLSPQSDHRRADISGNIVRFDALATRPEILFYWRLVSACVVSQELKFLALFVGKL